MAGEADKAMKTFVERENIGLVFSDHDELAEKLYDDEGMAALCREAQSKRKAFSFDSSADKLVSISQRPEIVRGSRYRDLAIDLPLST
ncbi:MAG: hypothetical protein WCC22_07045 [Terriglobales bacterium]